MIPAPAAEVFYDHALAAYSAHNPEMILPADYTLTGRILTGANEVFGYVAASKDTVMVSFRGTQTVSEWLLDFEVAIAPGAQVYMNGVHAGFQSIYNSLRASVIDLAAKAIDTPIDRLLITGHSLGAALATIFAFDAAKAFLIAPECCTFAGPRVGLPGFAAEFDARVPSFSRVVNHWDIVPQIPVPPMFHHVGSPIAINGGFTMDMHFAHSLPLSYKPGLAKLKASRAT